MPDKKADNRCVQDDAFDAEFLIGGKIGVLKGRDKEYEIEVKGMPECSNACPAGINVKAYVNLIANRRFEEAVEVIRKANPFPAVCGRVCTRPCEDSCEQGVKGDPVLIRALKRYASDYELARRSLVMNPCKKIYNEKIAIIGSGPAGLSAAVDLVRMGYPVTVFESKKESGGMLRYAIPPYRLSDRTLKREIDWIKGLGVVIKEGKKIDDPDKLLKKGYSAVLIATGAPKSFFLGIEGEGAKGIIDALWFLNGININNPFKIKGKDVVVVGGGSTAFDAARSAIRLNARKVTLAYRRGLEEMPAEHEEIKDAQKEGVKITTLAIPKRIITKNNKVTGIEFFKAKLGEPDDSGRRRPEAIKNSEFVIKADIIIPAIGTRPDFETVGNVSITTSKGKIKVDEKMETAVKGVFAAGDVELGPSSVVEAIGRGHKAANGINSYLRGTNFPKKENIAVPIVLEPITCTSSIHTPKRLEEEKRVTSFDEVEQSFTDFEAVEEASRCSTCGPCHICVTCLPNCSHKQVVAEIDNIEFLLKVPLKLSLEVTEKGLSSYKLKSGGKEKTVKLHSLTAFVDGDLCIGCGRCEEVCSYRAIRNILSKDKITVAKVVHDACASCSACVSACPSGAISQGYMSDEKILLRIKEEKSPFEGIIGLLNYWSVPSPIFGSYNGIVEVMSERKISPSFLIRALVRSGKGVLVIGPSSNSDSHYLPWEESSLNVIKRTKDLLKLVGISPDRIQYVESDGKINPLKLLKEFFKSLEKKNLGMLKIPIPDVTGPLAESIAILRIMWANFDTNASDELQFLDPIKPGSAAFFEGCLPMLHMIGKSHKLYDLGSTRKAIYELMKRMNIQVGFIEGLCCPAKGLLYTKTEGIEEIVSKITSNNLKAFKKANPKKLILGTPESYLTFSKDFGNVFSLVDELYKASKSYTFSKINKTVAIHSACSLDKDPFLESTKKLLKLVPGIKTIELKERCGNSGFENICANSKKSALNLMMDAKKNGADAIVCTSPNCESHLLLCLREGSWRLVDIEVTNVYKLLLSSLGGDA